MTRLDDIPGVAQRTSEVIIAETGGDMSHFPSHQHLASWAGVCPGHNESGGKRRSGKTTHGNVWLADALIQAAWAAARTNDSYLQAKFWRIAGPRADDTRKKKAAVAVAHKILIAAYHLMADPTTTYHDLGADHFARRDDPERHRDRLVAQLAKLGIRRRPHPPPRGLAAALTTPTDPGLAAGPLRRCPHPCHLASIHVSARSR